MMEPNYSNRTARPFSALADARQMTDTLPLILLSIPAIASGWLIGTILYGNWFGGAITDKVRVVLPEDSGP